MTGDLTALIAEREEVRRQGLDLDARIKKITDAKEKKILDRLADLEYDLNEFARWRDIPLESHSRKNDFIFTLGKVIVTFHNQYGGDKRYISVRWGNSTAEFTRELPAVNVMRAFITAILEGE